MLYRRVGNGRVVGGFWVVALVGAVLLLPTCDPTDSDDNTARLGQAVGSGSEPAAQLGPRALTAATGYRVSPAWSPSGRWLAVAGLRGQGLYLLPVDGGPERVVDADFRGPWKWRKEGTRDVLCFGSGTTADALDAETWEVLTPCVSETYDDVRGDRIHRVGGRTFYNNSRLGTVTIVWEGQSGQDQTIPLDTGAWGAKVSPDGRYVAYCSGTLAKAELLLLDVNAGRTTSLGTGAHVAWFPDSLGFVYTVISRVERIGRAALVTAADLHLYDVATAQSRCLDQTDGRSEVQPVVSPDGGRIAYADWRSGAVLVRPAPTKVAP